MTIEEIFNQLFIHMNTGIAFHHELAKAYSFLGLNGYANCHIYHQQEETQGYIRLLSFYVSHYHKIIKSESINPPAIIPESWYKYTTFDVDINTQKKAIKDLTEKWIAWEKETKKLYQFSHKKLEELDEIDAMYKIDKYIKDVSKELVQVEQLLIQLTSINYDMPTIIMQQKQLEKKYKGW